MKNYLILIFLDGILFHFCKSTEKMSKVEIMKLHQFTSIDLRIY